MVELQLPFSKEESSAPDFQLALDEAVGFVAEAMQAEFAAIYLVNSNRQSYTLRATRGGPRDALQKNDPVPLSANTAINHALHTRTPVIIASESLENRFETADRPAHLRHGSTLIVPILLRNREAIGCFQVSSDAPRQFGDQDLRLLSRIAAHVVYALEWAWQLDTEKRRTEELARSNAFIAALGRLAARLQTSLDPDRVMETLGAELGKLGFTCIVALLERDSQELIIRYASLELKALTLAEKLTGLRLKGFHISRQRWPIYSELIDQKHPVFLSDAKSLAVALLPGFPASVVERVVALAGVRGQTPAIYLPLLVEDRVLGILGLWGQGLRESDVPAVAVLAGQVAGTFEVARLHQRAEHAAVLEERERLSRELHDSMTQSLYSVRLFAEAAWRLTAAGDVTRAKEYLSRVSEMAQQAQKEMRLLVYHLRPSSLRSEGLVAALQRRLDAVEKRAGLDATLSVKGALQLSPTAEVELYYVVQEALNNALRHSASTRVDVVIRDDGDEVELQIVDNGRGFDPARLPDRGGLGLLNMRERAERLGGSVAVFSNNGQGTRVQVKIKRKSLA